MPPRAAILPLGMALAFLPLLFLGGCATQAHMARTLPAPANATPVSLASGTADGAPGGAVPTDANAPGTVVSSLTAAGTADAAAAGAAAGAASAGAADDADTALSGPPADSVVTAKPADLFARIRSGFMLQDVDEPAIDSQANWFANHPEFLSRTWSRASLWLYYIVGQLEQRNMPRELALLPVIESAFKPYAYSRADASGLWQFVSDTGRRFGLKQDWWYDGRRDPIEATRAALDYLQALHDEFNGDWLLAIAAYNCGELLVEREIQRNERLHRPTDFWHLRLPAETRGYVPELLAMRRVVADPAKYGLEFTPIPDEPYFVKVATGGQISLKVVADIAGISVDDLYELNPAFHRPWTDPSGPFWLLVPADAAEGLQQTLAQLTPDERMRVGHYTVQRRDTLAHIAREFKTSPEVIRELNGLSSREIPVVDADLRVPAPDIQLPEKVEQAALLADHRGRRSRGRYVARVHVVRRGDTLYGIAQRMGTSVRSLAALNGISPSDPLRTGQRLRLSAGSTRTRSAGVHVRRSAHTTHTRRASLLASAAAPRTASAGTSASSGASAAGRAAASVGHRLSYVVRRGDTLYRIARALRVTVHDLLAWNDVDDARNLHPGQVLVAFVKTRS
jgi:membrane-bound lytic murein transglycosylase D